MKTCNIHTSNNMGIKTLPFSLREMFLKEKANWKLWVRASWDEFCRRDKTCKIWG